MFGELFGGLRISNLNTMKRPGASSKIEID